MTAPDGRRVGLAHLSLLDVDPPRLVDLAAGAGFDFVGLRVRPATGHERPHDLRPGSRTLRETLARLREHEMTVKDVEFLLLDGTDQRGDWLPMLEAGHALGASSLTVAVADPEPSRVQDTLARLAEDGLAHGISPAVEPISYQAVRTVPRAHELARAAGCDVLVDTLHMARVGASAAELAAVAPRVPLVQVCDAVAAAPRGREALVAESRAGRRAPGEGALDLAGVVAAVEAGLHGTPRADAPVPVSVEVPDPAARARLGDAAWARHLHAAAVATLARVRPRPAAATPAAARTPEEP